MSRTVKPLTIVDVAEHAGVSLSTVSRVMNGNMTVDPKMAARVRAAASELNYTANPLARSLVLGKTQTVSVLVPDLANPTFQAILRGLSRAASRSGFHVLIADTNEMSDEERPLAIELRRRTDGIVLCAPRMPGAELSALVQELGPVVVINREPTMDYSVVAADYRHGLTELIQHLYGLGHRRVAYLAGIDASSSNAQRLNAVHEFTHDHPDFLIMEIPCGVGFKEGADVLDHVLEAGVTAVLAFNDLVGMGLMSAAQARKVRVPEDLSIVGFDDIPFAAYTTPPLTTASVPAEELGEEAWLKLGRILTGEHGAESVNLQPEIKIRGSAGPVHDSAGHGARAVDVANGLPV